MPRTVNVSGLQNNCGPHVFAHMMLDHWDRLPLNNPTYKSIIHLFSRHYGVPADAVAIKHAIDQLGYVDREIVLGPVLREHMALVLANTPPYQENLAQSFIFEINQVLEEAGDGLEVNDKIRRSNADYFRSLSAEFRAFRLNEDNIDREDTEAIKREFIENQLVYWQEQGFRNVIEYMANNRQAYMFTIEEMCTYADIMGINLSVYHGGDHQMTNHLRDEPLMQMVVHNEGAHWQYEAAAHIDDLAVEYRNQCINDVAPEDRVCKFSAVLSNPNSTQAYQQVRDWFAHQCGTQLSQQSRMACWQREDARAPILNVYKGINEKMNQILDQNQEIDPVLFNQLFDTAVHAIHTNDTAEFDTMSARFLRART